MPIIKVSVLVLVIFQCVHSTRIKLPCFFTIDRDTERNEEQEFFKHIEDYFGKHEIIMVIRGLLNKGHIYVEMRFYLQPVDNSSIEVLPDYLKLKLDSKFDKKFLAQQLGKQKQTEFLKMLKNSFNKNYYQSDSVKIKPNEKFGDMDEDKVILSYLEKIPGNPFYMFLIMKVSSKGMQLNLIEISSDHRKEFCPLLEKQKNISESLTQRDALINVTMKADNMTRKVNIIIPDISKAINTVKSAKKLYGGNHVVVPMNGKESLVLIKLHGDTDEGSKRSTDDKDGDDDDDDDDDDGDSDDESSAAKDK